MSSHQPEPNSRFNEEQWVIEVRRVMENDNDDDVDEEAIRANPITIFSVPKSLKTINPDSYTPQQVAIGPYHNTRSELHDMEKYKLRSVKRSRKDFQNFKIQNLVKHLEQSESLIRASYDKVLNFKGETLAWMMAVDVTFLFEILQVCAVKQGNAINEVNETFAGSSSRFSHLVDMRAHNAILRDISMLENQIPLSILQKYFELLLPQPDLSDLLIVLCKELTPFKMALDDQDSSLSKIALNERAHLLDVLYHFFVPTVQVGESSRFIMKEVAPQAQEYMIQIPVHNVSQYCGPMRYPLEMISKFQKSVEMFLKQMRGEERNSNRVEDIITSSGRIISKPQSLEQISVPSVSELVQAGVHFQPTDGGISDISFDIKTSTLNLPIITMDINTEVILRNLVAYEACSTKGPLVLAKYMDLMNGMIDTEEDARILHEKGIIINQLKNNEEVANLWNGMSKSIRLTKVPFLDTVIQDVNEFHEGKLKFKFREGMKTYVYGPWRLLTVVCAFLITLLMGIQAFCSIFGDVKLIPKESAILSRNNSTRFG